MASDMALRGSMPTCEVRSESHLMLTISCRRFWWPGVLTGTGSKSRSCLFAVASKGLSIEALFSLRPLASALTQTHSLPEFVAWALLAGVIQIATFWIVRRIALPDVSARIERGEMSSALYLMMISIAVGILNAACMTA